MGSPKFEIAEQIKMWIVVYLVCFLALYCVLSALHALYDPLNLPALTSGRDRTLLMKFEQADRL